ncbi:MAG TPA: tRNA uridine-5-carboxymethylaminomethyl(34) synthesis GTPase MnmE [Verrucomicrobiae bacterium]|nr:tRNA uridine-5-carboxymethylaminomethyl(34) synthesis GTPase MnmE [Verrucomicrobiae bacterium]
MLDDTVAAIATPLGEGGLAVVRLSGPKALEVADKSFRGAVTPSEALTHTLHFGTIERDGKKVDEVMLAVMRAPRTYTKEDVVEISCHGGLLPAKLVLDALLENGARLAEPGEFTKRAFLNGRIDLAQAEAVVDLIHSRTELALDAAHEQLAGKLSQRINRLRDEMMIPLAHVEAHIDFPDEDISPDTKEQLISKLQHGVAFMDELLATADEGQLLRRGIRAAIVGRPNAGKSSLLNQLLGHDRAIVSPIPGTTRDTIEETANIRGIPVVFVDTAGLREAGDEIEEEGIRRSRASLAKAELVLHVLDGSEPLSPLDLKFLAESASKKRIVVRNKIDLPARLEFTDPTADVSCVTGKGIEALKDAIKQLVWRGQIKSEMLQVMINSRHQDALKRGRAATITAMDGLYASQNLELVAMELRIAVNAVGEIVGKTSTEDLLDSIFSQFCIGK